MAEQLAEIHRGELAGLVPDITKPIALTDPTFGLSPSPSGTRIYATIPETGFYSFTLTNNGQTGGANFGFHIGICDSNDVSQYAIIQAINYLTSGTWSPWTTISQSAFFEKGTRITILGTCSSSSGFSVLAFKAKKVNI